MKFTENTEEEIKITFVLCDTSSFILLRRILPIIRKNIECSNIFIILNNRFFFYFKGIKHVRLIDEDKLYEGLTYDRVQKLLESRGFNSKSTGTTNLMPSLSVL